MATDLLPFVNRLQIVTKDLRVLPLGRCMNYAQHQIVQTVNDALNERRRCRIVTLKARQIGVSTITEALMFSLAMILHRMKGLVISHEADSATHLLQMTNHFWETWRFRDLYTIRHNSVRHMRWEDNGSSIRIATAKNVGAGRSQTIQFLHGSEVAFWDDPLTLMTGLAQSIPMTYPSVVVLESTANGIGGYFYETWNAAVDGDTDYVPLFFPWHQHPEYTAAHIEQGETLGALNDEERVLKAIGISDSRLAWRRWAIKNLCGNDVMRFHQEMPTCVTGDTRVGTTTGFIRIDAAAQGMEATFGKVVATHPQPVSRTHRMTTALGYTLQGTWDHPLMLTSGLLCPLRSSEGQVVQLGVPQLATSYHVERWMDCGVASEVTFDENWGRMLGLFMGDGSFYKNTMEIACTGTDLDVVEEVERLIRSLFDLTPHQRVVGTKKGGIGVRVTDARLKSLFDRLGMLYRNDAGKGQVRRKIHVPEVIWRSPRPVVAEFLSGLFEADGFNSPKAASVKLFSKDEQFMCDVQLLLLAFGITSRRTRAVKRTNGYEYWGNELTLRASEAREFNKQIGFLSRRKTFNIEGRNVGRPPAPISLSDEVVRVEASGEEVTYDLTIEGDAVFDANGIITHNTPEEAFVVTGHNIFPDAELTACYQPMEGMTGYLTEEGGRGVRFQPSLDGPVTIYRWPGKDMDRHKYMIAGDATRSIQGDYSCAQVLNRRTWEQVAVFHQKIDPVSFGDQMTLLGRYYNWAVLCPEIQGAGDATISRLISLNYPFLFEHRKAERIPGQPETVYGWWSGVRAKQEAVGNLLKVVIDGGSGAGGVILHHHRTYQEMRAYVSDDKGGFKNGASERHDDTVTALAIAMTCTLYEAPNINAGMGVYGGSQITETARVVNEAMGRSGFGEVVQLPGNAMGGARDEVVQPWEIESGSDEWDRRMEEING